MTFKLLAAAVASAALALTGCVGYEVKPPKPAEYPKADAPVPLKVGVLIKNMPYEWVGMGMSTSRMDGYRNWNSMKPMFAQVDGIGGKFVEALSGSRAFASVDEVKSMGFFGSDTGGHNLFMDAQFSGKFTQDPAQFGKAFISGFLFFLPVPFIRYQDTYHATADLSVYDGAGRLVHKYSEQQEVGTESALFSAGMPSTIAAGIEAASANLASKLVSEIIADREGFVRASKSSGGVARRKPEPEPEAEAAAEPAATPAGMLTGPAAASTPVASLLSPAPTALTDASAASSAAAPAAETPAAADSSVADADSSAPEPAKPAPHAARITSSEAAVELMP